ncbi:MAG: glycosyltransferase family 39 protein [Anaerolineae bacterium]|nr:glycosyltransferase family 39 protein [Anaerolineae bacterium]
MKRYTFVGGLFLLALAVRLWRLTTHSLWFDETMSLFWAGQPVARIWEVGLHLVEDKHPPLYYSLLHGWMGLFGSSDAAVRSLGSLLGALAVLPACGMGYLLGDRRSGALAGLLVALNPFLVWYSQEVRMFMPAATFALFGLYGLLRSLLSPQSSALSPRPAALRLGWWALALLGLVGAVYSYLFSAFLLPVAALWLLVLWLWMMRQGQSLGAWRFFLCGAFVLALAGALIAPLLWAAWRVSGGESLPGRMFGGMAEALARLAAAYTLHRGPWGEGAVHTAQVGAGLLTLLGLLLPLRGRASTGFSHSQMGYLGALGRPLLALYLFLPLFVGGLLQSRDRTIFDEPRYFTFLVPAFCLLWGRALAALWQRVRLLGWVALAAVLAVHLVALSHLWLPQNLREDWRTAAAYVETHAGANDAVLVHVDYVRIPFQRYFGGPQPVFFPFTERLNDPAQVEPPLLGLLPFDSVWLVQSHTQEFDPHHLVERWLAERFPLATEQYPAGITVKRFLTRYRLPELPPDVPRLDAACGPHITLAGCAVDDERTPATDERSHPPSAWVHVRLYWRTEAKPPADYTATVRMVDGLGQVWGERLYREQETLRVWPTSRWEPGEIVRQEVDVNLNPITPPGEYRIVAGLADAAGQPVGSEVICGAVQVVK